MTQIQLTLDEDENRYITIHQAKSGFKSKARALKDIIRRGMKNDRKTKK